jgi:hypothetical protein
VADPGANTVWKVTPDYTAARPAGCGDEDRHGNKDDDDNDDDDITPTAAGVAPASCLPPAKVSAFATFGAAANTASTTATPTATPTTTTSTSTSAPLAAAGTTTATTTTATTTTATTTTATTTTGTTTPATTATTTAGQFAPSALAVDGRGNAYVAGLGGTTAGGASLVRFDLATGQQTGRWDGFTSVTGLTVGWHGTTAYLSEATGGSAGTGQVVRVNLERRTSTAVAVPQPAGLALRSDGSVYVSAYSTSPAKGLADNPATAAVERTPGGQLWRIRFDDARETPLGTGATLTPTPTTTTTDPTSSTDALTPDGTTEITTTSDTTTSDATTSDPTASDTTASDTTTSSEATTTTATTTTDTSTTTPSP